MQRLYRGVVKHRKVMFALFLAAFVICLFLSGLVRVNYDINDYLPETAPSTVALDVMQEEFGGGIPNGRVMVRDVTIPEALEYKEKIAAVDGVTDVTWLDDSVSLTTPLSMMDQDMLESYYQDNCALFSVTMDDEKEISATDTIREIVGQRGALTGSAVSTAYATVNTVKQIQKIAFFAVLFALFVLVLTTSSWLEPLLILMGLGVAVVINSGTNLMFGEISFVTNAAGSILQLAVSLDYSVFLNHRFTECREECDSPEEAMVQALCKSTSSILSSGLTTVIGFLALVLMQFRIGSDLGLALAKGVAISLLTVFLFMPAVFLETHRLLDKTRHRRLVPEFHRFGKFVRRISIPMVCLFAVVVVPSFLASNSNEFYYGSSHILGADTQYGEDTAAIRSVFGQSDTYVLLVPKGDTASETALSDALHQIPEIRDIISYVDMAGAEIPMEYLDADTLALLESEHYSRMVLSIETDYEGENTFSLVKQIRDIANEYYPDSYYLAGEGVSTYDLMETVTADMVKVNFLAIGAVFLVLLLAMKSMLLPVILVVSIETAIWLNLSVPYFSGSTIFYIAYLIISSIQLGATVDYAILMTQRYKENRESLPKGDAVVKTISDVTVSILTSGSVLTVCGYLLGYMSSNQLLAQLGRFIGRGAIFSLVIVLLVLPGLLSLFDRLIIKKKPTLEVSI